MGLFAQGAVLLVSYLFGAIPFGLLIVKWKTGKDIRKIESGRTGGTNVMRAAGFWAGFATAWLDIFKGFGAARLAMLVAPEQYWLHVLAPVLAIVGHNYSIFLAERDENGRLHLRGGAGGATAFGGVMGLWPPAALIMLPVGFAIFWFVGYASVTTMSVPVMGFFFFLWHYTQQGAPWNTYLWYAILAEVLVVWALRPNIKRLMNGTERMHGWRAKRRQKQQEKAGI